MLFLVVAFAVALVIIIRAAAASSERRKSEIRRAVLAAYEAGRDDGRATPLPRRDPNLGAQRDSYRAGTASQAAPRSHPEYRRDQPAALSDEAEVQRSLEALQGRQLEICFTGFPEETKVHLEEHAANAGMRVRTSVTKHLTFLCIGEAPGPAKLQAAEAASVPLICAERFHRMAAGG